jgi:hypothetical protein
MRMPLLLGTVVAALIVCFAGAASALSITMTPNPAEVGSLFGSNFTLRLDSGDSDTNILNFTATGGGCTDCLSVAVAAILFDDVSVLSATDSAGGMFNPDNVVRGIVTPDGAVAGLLVDFGDPNSESFSLTLNGTPTTATLYALDFRDVRQIESSAHMLANVLDKTRLTFSTDTGSVAAVPEPSAALVFGAGLLVAHAGIRRR